jgi:hypothetical protein
MTDSAQTDAARASAALTAFLRGIERRGAVFADLFAGDPIQGEQAFAIGLCRFRDQALAQPYAHWPRLFWRSLAAAPPPLRRAAAPHWRAPFAALAGLGAGARAALLLRLAAGLTEAEAAAVLGVASPTYRLALQRALPRRADGGPDPEAWRALDAAVRQAIHDLPAERLAHLARLREAAVQGRRPELIGPLHPPVAEVEATSQRPHARRRRLLWVGVGACALALAGSFVWPLGWEIDADTDVRVQPLSPADAPAARYDRASALRTERDFELLAAEPLQPPANDPAFYAWYAAERIRAEAGEDPAAGMREPEADTSAESAEPESSDAP